LNLAIQVPAILSPQETMMIHISKDNFPIPRYLLGPPLGDKRWRRDASDFTVEMDLRSIVLSLGLKGMNTHAVNNDLVATFHEDAPAYSTVTIGFATKVRLGFPNQAPICLRTLN
jgi:hypothetical protein